MNALTMAYPATGANVRVVTVDGEPRLVLADVCAALEIGNPSMVAARTSGGAVFTLIAPPAAEGNAVTNGRSRASTSGV